jgi:hypothetical protein
MTTPTDRVTELLGALGNTPEKVAFSLRAAGITGVVGDPTRCPVANYLQTRDIPVNLVTCLRVEVDSWGSVPVANPVADFIAEFDDETYPQLIQRGAR